MPLLSLVLVAAAFVFVAAGCQQGEGDRCEMSSDCSGGLTCEKNVCMGGAVTGADAAVAIGPRPTVPDVAERDAGAPVDGAVTVDVSADSAAADRGEAAPGSSPDGRDL